MPSHTTFISAELAQTQTQPSGDPNLAVSRLMGKVMFLCLLAALIVALVMKAAKGKKK